MSLSHHRDDVLARRSTLQHAGVAISVCAKQRLLRLRLQRMVSQ